MLITVTGKVCTENSRKISFASEGKLTLEGSLVNFLHEWIGQPIHKTAGAGRFIFKSAMIQSCVSWISVSVRRRKDYAPKRRVIAKNFRRSTRLRDY